MKVVIVGGVAGGASAAARIRRLDEKAEIIIFERSGYISYANCGLPYYIGGVIENQRELTLQTPENFYKRFRVDVRIHHEVIQLHPEKHEVSVKNLETGEVFIERYDKLLLSPGAIPAKPKLSGMDIERLFTLRTVEDTLRIRRFIDENQPKSVVLAGGGFISLELAENLRDLGMEVTIIQRPLQLMNPFDADMAVLIHAKLREKGIKLMLGHSVEGFEEHQQKVEVLLKDEAAVSADMVVLAIGVVPESQLAKDAGLKLGIKGSILVNERMETSVADIYAVGDAVQVKHSVTGEDALLSLAGPANKQGRIAAENICGGNRFYFGSQGSSIIKIFDMSAAVTGINEKEAKRLGLDYDKVYLTPMNHAGYYPGGRSMLMKVLFERQTARILGAQIIGYDGVDKRIDVLATAIHAKMSAYDLQELDLAYAPSYSSAKDPVNMAGFMIENILSGRLKQFFYEDLAELNKEEDVIRLDVRTSNEYLKGHLEGFVNIPVDELRNRISELSKGKKVYVMCQSGIRSYIACRLLMQHGFDCYNFAGGYSFYQIQEKEGLFMKESYPCGREKV